MDSKKILIYGEILFDHFDNGAKHLGGAPFNVAWHLKGFGFNPVLVSAIGSDSDGKEILERMNKWNLDNSAISLSDKPTGRVDIVLNHGEPEYSIRKDCAWDFIPLPTGLSQTEGDLLYFGSLALRSRVSRDTLKSIKKSFKGTVFADINIRHPWFNKDEILPLVKGCNWLKLNIDEFNELSTSSFLIKQPFLSIKEFADSLGIENLILTMGEDGAYIYSGSSLKFQPVSKVTEFVSAVGAGDAFASTVIRGILNKWTSEEILNKAASFASDICQIQGAISEDREFYINI